MAAFASDTVLDLPLDYIVNATNTTTIDVVSGDPGGTWSNISGMSLGTFAIDLSGSTLSNEGTGRKVTIAEIAMGSVGAVGTPAHVVLHNGADAITFQTVATGTPITDGAAVTVATFNIVSPQPTSAMTAVTVTPQTVVLGMKKVDGNEKVDSNTAAVPANVESGADNAGQRDVDKANSAD